MMTYCRPSPVIGEVLNPPRAKSRKEKPWTTKMSASTRQKLGTKVYLNLSICFKLFTFCSRAKKRRHQQTKPLQVGKNSFESFSNRCFAIAFSSKKQFQLKIIFSSASLFISLFIAKQGLVASLWRSMLPYHPIALCVPHF